MEASIAMFCHLNKQHIACASRETDGMEKPSSSKVLAGDA